LIQSINLTEIMKVLLQRSWQKLTKRKYSRLVVPPKESLGRAGFLSPAYNKSKHIELDTEFLKGNKCVSISPDAPETESYRQLRIQILQRIAKLGGNSVMITSALPGEGKTLTAINLALTFSRDFSQTVLLVDCDLRRQSIHEYLGIHNGGGLPDYLLDGTPLDNIIIWPGIDKLTLISGGRTILESAELLGSPRMVELVAEMKSRYPDRIIIFDVPPVLAAADAVSFAPLVDHIVVVTMANETRMRDVKKALSLLPREKILGLVLNRYGKPQKQYYYPS